MKWNSKKNVITGKYLDMYKIEGSLNLDQNPCFKSRHTYKAFQGDLLKFQELLKSAYNNQESISFYKFGDGDYYFLKGLPVGSANPGKRALSRKLTELELGKFKENSKKCDYYLCEIYPENRKKFRKVLRKIEIDFPAEYVYGLLANKWILSQFKDGIGLIGADKKIELIKELMQSKQYRDYLGINEFSDYISIPQKYACDDLNLRLTELKSQLEESKSRIFLVGIGHLKSGVLSELKAFKNAIFLDVGSGIDALAGLVDKERPFFGSWINHRINDDSLYEGIDFLQYNDSNTKLLDRLDPSF